MNPSIRIDVLRSLGASDPEISELLAYNENQFDHTLLNRFEALPPPDEPFVHAWENYAREAQAKGSLETLRSRLVQLSFPIQEGISQSDTYRLATRNGVLPRETDAARGLQLKCPELFRFHIQETLAGRIPVLTTAHRYDFVSLLQALTHKNEPADIPSSTGAMMVSGYNNWDRIRTLKARWKADHPDDTDDFGWHLAFQNIIGQKGLYQDKFIILSDGPYSDVSARDLNLSEDQWKEISLTIRREHECTHFVTKTLLGSMQNRLLDELVADYMGMVEAIGRFRADWFLRFLGLEDFPRYRSGGRLENYRGDPPLSDHAFQILQILAQQAAINLETFDQHYRDGPYGDHDKKTLLLTLTRLNIEEMASTQGVKMLKAFLKIVSSRG